MKYRYLGCFSRRWRQSSGWKYNWNLTSRCCDIISFLQTVKFINTVFTNWHFQNINKIKKNLNRRTLLLFISSNMPVQCLIDLRQTEIFRPPIYTLFRAVHKQILNGLNRQCTNIFQHLPLLTDIYWQFTICTVIKNVLQITYNGYFDP